MDENYMHNAVRIIADSALSITHAIKATSRDIELLYSATHGLDSFAQCIFDYVETAKTNCLAVDEDGKSTSFQTLVAAHTVLEGLRRLQGCLYALEREESRKQATH